MTKVQAINYLYSSGMNEEQVNEVVKALATSESRVPLFSSDGYADGSSVWDMAECPNCGREFEDCDDTWKCNFCPDCGQPLKWEEDSE